MNTKQAIIIGSSITIIGVLGLILFNRMKKFKESKVVENTNESSSSVSSEADNYDTSNDRKILKDAMTYWLGTNEQAIDDLILRTSQAQRDKIRKDWDSNVSMYKGDTLKLWIEEDYSGSEEKRILKSFGY
jgi:hypothetical protein